MFLYYSKLSAKVVLWHLIGQVSCMSIGFVAFGLLTANYRIADILVTLLMTGGYAVFMYSKLYKVGERDTKSYVPEKPYPCKGLVLSALLTVLSIVFAVLYAMSFSAGTILSMLLTYFPFRIWGYTYCAFLRAADGSISLFYWVLYFAVPLISCTFGYLSGMHRWEIGYQFFKNLVYRKKDS